MAATTPSSEKPTEPSSPRPLSLIFQLLGQLSVSDIAILCSGAVFIISSVFSLGIFFGSSDSITVDDILDKNTTLHRFNLIERDIAAGFARVDEVNQAQGEAMQLILDRLNDFRTRQDMLFGTTQSQYDRYLLLSNQVSALNATLRLSPPTGPQAP